MTAIRWVNDYFIIFEMISRDQQKPQGSAYLNIILDLNIIPKRLRYYKAIIRLSK